MSRQRELERLIASYNVAKEMGFHKNAYWQSIHRSIVQLTKGV